MIAPLVTLGVGALVMALGCASIVRRPKLLACFATPAGRGPVIWFWGLAALGVFVAPAGGLFGESVNGPLFAMLAGSVIAFGIIGLSAWPWAFEADKHSAGSPSRSPQVWGLLVAALLWSIVWIVVISQIDSVKVRDDFMFKDVSPYKRPFEYVSVTAFVVSLAIVEEIIYRGAVQQAVAKITRLPWLGVGVSAVTWALAHGGYTEPFGVKEFQIFVLGVIIGVAAQRHGLRAGMMIHIANNLLGLGMVFVEKA